MKQQYTLYGTAKTGYIHKSDVSDKKLKAQAIVNPKQTYTYTEMIQNINKLKETYPGLISTVGYSVERRRIPFV